MARPPAPRPPFLGQHRCLTCVCPRRRWPGTERCALTVAGAGPHTYRRIYFSIVRPEIGAEQDAVAALSQSPGGALAGSSMRAAPQRRPSYTQPSGAGAGDAAGGGAALEALQKEVEASLATCCLVAQPQSSVLQCAQHRR